MTPLSPFLPSAFGLVDTEAEHGLFLIETAQGGTCRLTLVARNERGYPRRELASIPGATWRMIVPVVQKELIRGMDTAEQGPNPPFFRTGENVLSPLITRELALLLWALMEDGEGTHIHALLNGWRQLAREERWWLYARASNPSQRQGQGWRRALFFALTDPADTRTAPRLLEIMEVASAQKKNSKITSTIRSRTPLRHPSAQSIHRRPKTNQQAGPNPPRHQRSAISHQVSRKPRRQRATS